jgi:molecular chaperone DnaK
VDKVQVLSAALMKVGEAMYEKAAADADTGPASQADQADDEDDVVDAEFEDVDDENAA